MWDWRKYARNWGGGKGRINVKMWKKLAINTGFECVLILCNPTPHGYCPEAGHGNVYRHAIGRDSFARFLGYN